MSYPHALRHSGYAANLGQAEADCLEAGRKWFGEDANISVAIKTAATETVDESSIGSVRTTTVPASFYYAAEIREA